MAASREILFPATPQIVGGGRILPSPSQFYLTGEDRLRVVSANSVAGVALKVQVRTAPPSGGTQAHSFDHVPNSNRSTKTTEHALDAGSLLNITAFAGTGTPKIGQTFVIVQLIRGSGAAAIVLGTLLSGYVTSTQALGFPGSPIQTSIEGGGVVRSFAGTQPAAGAEIVETVPTGARWALIGCRYHLLTDATVANRRTLLVFNNGSFDYFRSASQVATPAGTAHDNYFAQGMPLAVSLDANTYVSGLCHDTMLLEGFTLRSSTNNLQAGDQYQAPFVVLREWLEVP